MTIKFPPVDDSMTKDDIMRHVRRDHPGYHRLGDKSLKGEWLRWHDSMHERASEHLTHEHTPLTLEEIGNAPGGVLELDKPLRADEAAVLKQLIDNDYARISSEMHAMAADEKARRASEIDAEWSDKADDLPRLLQRGRDIVHAYNSEMNSLLETAKDCGVKLRVGYTSLNDSLSGELEGKAEAIRQASLEVETNLRRALLALESQRLSTQRTVLRARVTPAAQQVLDVIPTADALMRRAIPSE